MTMIGLAGILLGLAVLVWFSFRGWSVLVLAPVAAIVAATRAASEPLLAHWTITFMGSGGRIHPAVLPAVPAGRGVRQADGGHGIGGRDRAVDDAEPGAAARGPRRRARRSVRHVWRREPVRRLLRRWRPWVRPRSARPSIPQPAHACRDHARHLATSTMSALPGTPAIQNAIPMPFFGTTPFRGAGARRHRVGHHAGAGARGGSGRAEARARRA